MRRPLIALVALLALVLAACGDGDATTTGPGPGRGDPPPVDGEIDAEVLALGEGVPPFDGPRAVRVLDADDPAEAAALFVEPERDAVEAAVEGADLDGRTLLGGLVHEGCFPAGGVAVVLVGDAVTFAARDLDEQEGEVACARAVVTSAVVAVATDDLPPGYGDPAGSEPVDGRVAGEVVLVGPTGYEPGSVRGPGLVRDPVDLEALLGRYDIGEPDPALLRRLETGDEVLVAGVVGEACDPPVGATVVRRSDDVELVPEHADAEPGLVCDALAQALVAVAVDEVEVAGVETVGGDPVDGPTGVGVVHLVEPVDVAAEPLAARADDGGGLDAVLADVPGAPAAADLPPVEDGAVRVVFVVGACQPDTAELVADTGSGTVRAEPQQTGAEVDCGALTPHVVVADLAAAHADLDPTVD